MSRLARLLDVILTVATFLLAIGLPLGGASDAIGQAAADRSWTIGTDDPPAGLWMDKAYGTRVNDHTWRTPDGVEVRAVLSTLQPDRIVWQISMSGDWTRRHEAPIEIHLPWLQTAPRDSLRVYSPYFGGRIVDWNLPRGQWQHGNAGAWPGYAYSPLMIFYDDRDGSGVGVTAWNDQLVFTHINWVISGDGQAGPFVSFHPYLDRGQTLNAVLEIRKYEKGLPDAHLHHYRQAFLLPWMDKLKITEATCDVVGPWTSSDWPSVDGRQYRRGDLCRIVRGLMNNGARGYIQWSSGEPRPETYVFEPDHRKYPWFAEYAAASTLLNGNFGCLIAPQFTGMDGTPANFRAARHRQFIDKLRADLKAAGVRYVYWDAAQCPQGTWWWIEPFDWLQLMLDWRAEGITVIPESSSDVAVVASGATLFYPAELHDQRMPGIITPRGKIFMLNSARIDWIQPALERGFVPIMDWRQFRQWKAATRPASTTQGFRDR
ncbi:hypothetical protein [Fontivita pretiosa]|uniref:hypothetical protein n=1 Tax=Fontivita pretiosa TaxID=2989684 RepID=UPI003D183B45